MKQVQTVVLPNDSVISAVDKLHPQDGDMLVFYLRTDEDGSIKISLNEAQCYAKFIQKFLNQNYNNVKFMMVSDRIKYGNGDSN